MKQNEIVDKIFSIREGSHNYVFFPVFGNPAPNLVSCLGSIEAEPEKGIWEDIVYWENALRRKEERK